MQKSARFRGINGHSRIVRLTGRHLYRRNTKMPLITQSDNHKATFIISLYAAMMSYHAVCVLGGSLDSDVSRQVKIRNCHN